MNELQKNVAFSELSAPKTWFGVATDILPLLDEPEKSGFHTPTELLSALATARNLTPRALIKQVEAAKFLLNTYPALTAEIRVTGGHSQVEYLAKIHKLDAAVADSLAKDVILGNFSVPAITNRYIALRDVQDRSSQSPAVQARMRALRYSDDCYKLVKENSTLFGALTPEDVVRNYRLNRMVLDAAVVHHGQLICVIEFIMGGVSSTTQNALRIIAKLALCRYRTETVWLLLPAWLANLSKDIQEEARTWGVTGIRIAHVVEEGEALRLEVVKGL